MLERQRLTVKRSQLIARNVRARYAVKRKLSSSLGMESLSSDVGDDAIEGDTTAESSYRNHGKVHFFVVVVLSLGTGTASVVADGVT